MITLVWALAIFGILLLAWILLSSFKSTNELFNDPFGLPDEWRWENFASAWGASNFDTALGNSLILVLSTGAATVLLAAPASYALSRFGVFGSRAITMAFAIGVGIPVQVIILPLYSIMNELYLVNSLEGVWLLYVATSLPFAVFFLTGFFISLPKEMEEAAALDGAGPVRTFVTIMLPLARSGLVTLLILNIISHWGETIIALVFLQTTNLETLPLALLKFLQRLQYTGADWGQLFAGVAIVIGPVLALYVWLGRRIIEGLTLGADR
ncbi:carbohydrate ABC transporter permease [Tessaracoccus sp. OS52]|uniref:carbohydrate ABC transporter permease n=1 Tax=Tessaracoccus sp. OS52 TaxID=2886691 RepID=UPI001D0F9F03|nr:carbohydrate ABC transporter permease [Tessaracoccus sp. OS52]